MTPTRRAKTDRPLLTGWIPALLVPAVLVSAGAMRTASADLIKLNNGGELRGTIQESDDTADGERLEIVTLSGGRVTVARENVQFATHRPLIVEVYETRARQTPDSVPELWELAEWCRKQGATLQDERADVLRRIIRIEPEHPQAHAGLKHTKRDGVWMTYDEARRSEGYVKYKGRYITPQELELIEKTEADLEAERAWYSQVRLWKGWLTGRNLQRREEGFDELTGIVDPYAVAALKQNFHEEEDARLRLFYVKILSRISGDKPVSPLVDRILFDNQQQIRYEALNGLSPEQYPEAAELLVVGLDDELNQVVRRAGRALGRVAGEEVIPDLIEALITTHSYRVRVPAGGTLSFGTDGSFGGGQSLLTPEIEAMLRAGQFPNGVIVHNPAVNQMRRTKIVRVKYEHQNVEVLTALQKLSGVDFGYNERNWRLWLTASKSGSVLP